LVAGYLFSVFSHFSFDTIGAKEKLTKENAGIISPPAGGDQRPTALDPCRLLKKAGENFHCALAALFDKNFHCALAALFDKNFHCALAALFDKNFHYALAAKRFRLTLPQFFLRKELL